MVIRVTRATARSLGTPASARLPVDDPVSDSPPGLQKIPIGEVVTTDVVVVVLRVGPCIEDGPHGTRSEMLGPVRDLTAPSVRGSGCNRVPLRDPACICRSSPVSRWPPAPPGTPPDYRGPPLPGGLGRSPRAGLSCFALSPGEPDLGPFGLRSLSRAPRRPQPGSPGALSRLRRRAARASCAAARRRRANQDSHPRAARRWPRARARNSGGPGRRGYGAVPACPVESPTDGARPRCAGPPASGRSPALADQPGVRAGRRTVVPGELPRKHHALDAAAVGEHGAEDVGRA